MTAKFKYNRQGKSSGPVPPIYDYPNRLLEEGAEVDGYYTIWYYV